VGGGGGMRYEGGGGKEEECGVTVGGGRREVGKLGRIDGGKGCRGGGRVAVGLGY